jgi:hypothetical protein
MRPLFSLPIVPLLFLEVHHNSSAPAHRWDAPYSLITPRNHPLSFAPGSRSPEFASLFAFQNQVSDLTIPPKKKLEIEGAVADFSSREW